MSVEKKGSRTYDLRKMEDLFTCVEIVTMARGALYPVDTKLASRLEKVSDALSAFAMNMEAGPPEPDQNEERGGKEIEQNPSDLLSDFPVSSESWKESPQSEKEREFKANDDEIIDIITGERIK